MATVVERTINSPERAALTAAEIGRYSRHLILPEVGMHGQERLKAARVAVVGTGGLGSPLALYLAAAGVGTLGLVDFDIVDASNLQRQILHGTRDVGRRKLDSARDRVLDLNPYVTIEQHHTRLEASNAINILSQYDLVVDGTDNFATRYLVNDVCVLTGRPNVYGSVFRFDGQIAVFAAPDGPCYRCLFREPPPAGLVPSCAEGGILGVLPGIIGSMQALEAIKLIVGIGTPLVGRMLLFDALSMQWREVNVRRDPACPVCGDNPTIIAPIDYATFCGDAVHTPVVPTQALTPLEALTRLQRPERVQLIDVREPTEWAISNLHEYAARLIPLATLGEELATLDLDETIIVHCKGGARSAKAVQLLRDAGARDVYNLTGGILAWSDEVDATKARY